MWLFPFFMVSYLRFMPKASLFGTALLIVFMLLTSVSILAQTSKIAEALGHLKDGKLGLAKAAIDEASKHEETIGKADTWYYKGYIYREIYKKTEDPKSQERYLAAEYFKKCVDMEPEGRYAENCEQQVDNIAKSYYNDAVIALNSKDPKASEESFGKFIKVKQMWNPKVDLTEQKINVYMALGGVYTGIYEVDKTKNKSDWYRAKAYFDKVLKINPDHINGNYNMGILYYNKAVNFINAKEYDIDLVALSDIQDTSIILFKRSLPFMETALELEPENENTLVGLSGIYFALNEIEKSNAIKERLEKLKQSKEQK